MLILGTTDKVRVKLSGTPAAELDWFSCWVDTNGDTLGSSHGVTNGTTAVDMVASPTSGARLVEYLSIYNADAAQQTVTVQLYDGTNTRILTSMIVKPAETLVFSKNSWEIVPTSRTSTDVDAIHDNISGEIAAVTAKTTPVDADVVLIEDSAASNAKKSLSWANAKTAIKSYLEGLSAINFTGSVSAKLKTIIKPSTATLTADECKGTLISNYDQSAQNVLTLPPAAEGLNFTAVISTAGAGAFYLSPDGSDRIYLDGTDIGPARVGMETPAVGAMIAFTAFQTGASSYAWAAQTIAGTWLDVFEFDVVSTQTMGGKFSILSGETISVDWGDGSALSTYSGIDQSWSKDYGSAVNKTVKIYGASALTKFVMIQSSANITFDLADLPRGLTFFSCQGSNTVTGDIADLPSGLTYFTCIGSNTVTGNLADLPSGLETFYCLGSNTIYGNIANLPGGLIYFNCRGLNTISDYSGKTWTAKPAVFRLEGNAALSAAEVDQLLIDLDDDLTWSTGDVIIITGNCDPPTAAADAAIASLEAEGVTVTVNT